MRSSSSVSGRMDLEGGSKEDGRDIAILGTYEDIGKESWKSTRWSLLFLLNLVAASMDPLFFYIPKINDELKCLKLDRNLGITAISLRFCVDLLQLMLWLHCNEEQLFKRVSSSLAKICGRLSPRSTDLSTGIDEPGNSTPSDDTTSRRLKQTARLSQLVWILPLPQVATIIVITMEGSRRSPHAITLLKFCVLSQFAIRAIRVYPSYKDATRKSPILLRGRVWVGAAFNLLLFVIVGHVLGAFWYLLSVGRNMDCWKEACERHAGCDVTSLYCIKSFGDKAFLDKSCPIEKLDNPPFDFGIYLPALQSHIVSSSNFSLKLLYCFWWGLRNLSSLAQNLETSAYQWEICFAISISISGLILFSLLIGNMQTYLQCLTNKDITDMKERRDKVKEIRNNLIKWKPFGQLPEDLRAQAIWCEDPKWLQNKDIDLKGILSNISPNLSLQIKEELCLPLLSKVPKFEKMGIRPQKMLCSRAKPEVFLEKSYIFRADSEIKQVVLILRGKVCSYKKDDGESGVSPQKLLAEYLGEELLNLVFTSNTLSPSDYPISPKHIKAVTKVEAFVLTVKDLRKVWSEFEGHLNDSNMRNWAKSVIQRGVKRQRFIKAIESFRNGRPQNPRQQLGTTNQSVVVTEEIPPM